MTEESHLTYRASRNNVGWYWELFTPDRTVIARGVADTEDEARADATRAENAATAPKLVEEIADARD
jgi:hypothetical protein